MEEAMFGKRCSLCGGKLNSNGICTECGLDNNKSDKNYRINQSECDHEPLTHVHYGKNEKPEKQPKPNTSRQSWQGSQKDNNRQQDSPGRGVQLLTLEIQEVQGVRKSVRRKSREGLSVRL